jgi:S1-C subfamily serine protease
MTRRLTFATLLLLGILDSRISNAADWVPVVRKVEPSIVRLEMTEANGGGVCSGVVVYEHIVVTVAHCIPNDPTNRSFAVNRKDAELLRVNRTLELAVLRVDKLKAPPLPFSARVPVAGLSVAIAGYGRGTHSIKYQFGWVSDTEDGEVQFGTWLDAMAVGGDSGGAVVDEDGDLITLIRAGWIGAHTLGVEPDVLREFVEPYAPKKAKP